MSKLSESEILLAIKYGDSLSVVKLRKIINAARAAKGETLLTAKDNLFLKIRRFNGDKRHPLIGELKRRWLPRPECPLSVSHFKKYGEDYLLGYLDGYELLDYGSSVGERSESYVRAYVDGYKEKLRENSSPKGVVKKFGRNSQRFLIRQEDS